MTQVRVLDHTGDTPVLVRGDDALAIAEATALFEKLMGEGKSLFPKEGGPRIKSVQQLLAETDVVAVPRIAGG